ncbi:MAG: hypothetical protein AAGD96_30205, partial [Chloroflexota bacterium]
MKNSVVEEIDSKSVSMGKVYRQHLLPNWVGWVAMGLITFLLMLYAVSLGTEDSTVVGIFCAGPIFALPWLTLAFRGLRPASAVYSLGCSGMALALTGVITAVLLPITSNNPADDAAAGLSLFFFLSTPLILIVCIPIFFYVRRMINELREGVYENRAKQALEIIEENGALTFSELGSELNVAPAAVDNLVDEIHQQKWGSVLMYAPHQRVYSHSQLRQIQKEMVDLIQRRGQLYLDDLAVMMQAPIELITEWIYQLVHENRFAGYINWEKALLYSTSARQLRKSSRCPNCT